MKYLITVSDLITRANTYINSVSNKVGINTWLDYVTSSIKLLRANRILPWMRKEYSLDIFTDILKYPIPDEFDALILINPAITVGNEVGKQLIYSTEKEFKKMTEVDLAVGWEKGEKFLLARKDGYSDQVIDEFDDDATEYTLAGDINNAISDEANFRSGDASLRFDIYQNVSNNFTISRDIDSIDISDIKDLATAFIHVYMPVVLSGGIKLRFGNNASNYYETSLITKQYHDIAFAADWNLLGVPLRNLTEVGSVDDTDITWMAVYCPDTGTVGVSSAERGYRVDGFYLRIGNNYEFSYNSLNIVKVSSSDDTWQAKVDNINNQILWDADFDDLLLFRMLDKAGFFNYRDIDIVQKALGDYAELNRLFESRYPTIEQRIKSNYYRRSGTF